MAKQSILKQWQLTTVQWIVVLYILAIVGATFLLQIPGAVKPGVTFTWLDSLFTAVSSISVTGLTVVNLKETFTPLGIFFIIILLQIGGLGIMALGTMVWLILGKKIGFRQRQMIMTDQNRSSLQGLVSLIRELFGVIVAIELVGTVVLTCYFLRYFPTLDQAFYQGLFASVAATTNAGFDITGESLAPFKHDYFVQTVTMILIILGSIGFPVLLELKDWWRERNNRVVRFSLFTKLTTTTFFLLTLLGVIAFYVFEWRHFLKDKSWHEGFFYALFQSVTTKSAGLATLDPNDLTEGTQLLLSGMMFIGASPSSVGGGIRTTTLAIIILSVYSFARGRNSVKVFQRELTQEDISKAFAVASVAVVLCSISVLLLTITEPFPLSEIIFEVSSAFGTTGLSTGITPDLSAFGKFVDMILMFIGRVGLLSFLYILRGKAPDEFYRYPKERVIIG
ncbi:TrkH family potassium uptake protein [Hazenella coriacea]|uniref:Potassium uptake TrkH family protein n=1 Tax=Hazenella coriacea TaxID=1179467 RepID=A0A4R3L7G5_9BACL|nr:TrkH family potassium uptake protein [Hazenella coriacea]TCS95891.1 potassium uptake TrkH family protein [Hazenella coriacea]